MPVVEINERPRSWDLFATELVSYFTYRKGLADHAQGIVKTKEGLQKGKNFYR